MNSLNEKLNDLIRISEKAKEISTNVLYSFAIGLDIKGNSDLSDFVLRVKNLAFYEANVNFDSNNPDYLASKSRLIEKYFKIINGGQK